MKSLILSCLASSLVIGATPSMADRYHYDAPYADRQAAWDGHAYWRAAGTVIGCALGALVGHQIDANSTVRCR